MKTLIIPCAGKSSRFPNMKPKYLLTHPDGRLMIEHAIGGLKLDSFDRIVITVVQQHDVKYDAVLWLEQVFANYPWKPEICVLTDFTKSASETIARTIAMMQIRGSIVVKDCDNYVQIELPDSDINACVGYNLRTHPNISNIPGKSFLIVTAQNLIADIVEKKIVSETIGVGVYVFHDANDFVEAYQELLNKGIQSELFISHIVSYMINCKNAIFETLEAIDYADWGTINEWRQIQQQMRTFFIDVDGVILQNSGQFGRVNWSNNTTILDSNVAAIKGLQEAGGQIIITTARTEEYREQLTQLLNTVGIKPHAILMGLHHAARVLINDFAATNPYPSAVAISLPRDADLQDYL